MPFYSLLPIQQCREGIFSANVSLSPFLTAWYTEDISRVWKGERGPFQQQKLPSPNEFAKAQKMRQALLKLWFEKVQTGYTLSQ